MQMRPGRRRIAGLSVVFLLGCVSPGAAAADGEAVVRIMPLGDSITQGYHTSYRDPLWSALREAGWKVDFVGTMKSNYGGGGPPRGYDTDHEGHWGWHADEVMERIAEWAERSNPDIVLLHLGTNDVGTGHDPLETAGEVAQVIALLRDQNPGIHVLLALIIPVDHAAANKNIREYNEALAETAALLDRDSSRVLVVDQFSGFDAAADTYDGVHPNENGNRKMADRWFSALELLRSD